LIHAGSLNTKPDSLRIQMKITHKDDIEELSYFTNYRKVLNQSNDIPFYLKKIQQNIICSFPILSDLTYNLQKKTNLSIDKKNSSINFFTKLYLYLFYSKTNFYN